MLSIVHETRGENRQDEFAQSIYNFTDSRGERGIMFANALLGDVIVRRLCNEDVTITTLARVMSRVSSLAQKCIVHVTNNTRNNAIFETSTDETSQLSMRNAMQVLN